MPFYRLPCLFMIPLWLLTAGPFRWLPLWLFTGPLWHFISLSGSLWPCVALREPLFKVPHDFLRPHLWTPVLCFGPFVALHIPFWHIMSLCGPSWPTMVHYNFLRPHLLKPVLCFSGGQRRPRCRGCLKGFQEEGKDDTLGKFTSRLFRPFKCSLDESSQLTHFHQTFPLQ